MKTIYKIGNLEHQIIPSKEMGDKLRKILKEENPDTLVWGPDIDVTFVPETIEEMIAITNYNNSIKK